MKSAFQVSGLNKRLGRLHAFADRALKACPQALDVNAGTSRDLP
jgi:hypothetical protein